MSSDGARSTALITGASGGIGEALARELGSRGHDLILAARSLDRLDAIAGEISSRHGVRARSVAVDLSIAGGPEALARAVAEGDERIDILVNNAGYATHGAFVEVDAPLELAEIQLNVTSLTYLAKLFVPAMVARRSGRVLNVASTAAFLPGPFMAVYYATKAYVLSLSVALAEELQGTGVTVTALCPGPTRTGFEARAGVSGTRLFQSRGVMDGAEVARAAVDGLLAGRTIVVPGVRNRFAAASASLAPRRLTAKLARSLNEPAPRH